MTDDRTVWTQGVSSIRGWYLTLPEDRRQEFNGLIDIVMELRQQLVGTVAAGGSGRICSRCGGECCRYGRYHVTVLDIAAYIRCGIAPVDPNFSSRSACPYSDASGCLIPPGFRPVTCVIFNCELIHDRLTQDQESRLHSLEQHLREAVTTLCRTFGGFLNRPLLLNEQNQTPDSHKDSCNDRKQ